MELSRARVEMIDFMLSGNLKDEIEMGTWCFAGIFWFNVMRCL
jgi:hypothetical protein